MPKLPAVIINGDFEQGLTAGGSSRARRSPVNPRRATIGARDVEIDGKPLVSLGGDFWHTAAFRSGSTALTDPRCDARPGASSTRSRSRSPAGSSPFGWAGSAGGDVALELRVPPRPPRRAGVKALDKPDADGYVAVRSQPPGSDVLHEATWDLVGQAAQPGRGHREGAVACHGGSRSAGGSSSTTSASMPKRPPPFHPPLWGWADIHCHPMAQAGFGDLLAGHMHGPVEDLGSCLAHHGADAPEPAASPSRWPSTAAPNDGSLATTRLDDRHTGARRRARVPGLAGLRRAHPPQDPPGLDPARLRGRPAADGRARRPQRVARSDHDLGPGEAQTDRDTVEPQVQLLREFVAHNGDWCGLATTPDDAATLIEANKMAFVLGLETDSINGWVQFDDFPQAGSRRTATRSTRRSTPTSPICGDLGIVQINLIHLTDNAFGGMAVYDVMFLSTPGSEAACCPTRRTA